MMVVLFVIVWGIVIGNLIYARRLRKETDRMITAMLQRNKQLMSYPFVRVEEEES